MLEDFLRLTNSAVSVIRISESNDGMGGISTVTTITGIPECCIWSPSQSRSMISDKLASVSSHVLVTKPSYYAFNIYDTQITYNSETYDIKGFDDVFNKNEIMVVGLDKKL